MATSKSDLIWTSHAKKKRAYYKLSKAKILKTLRSPDRTEKGIAAETVACMKKKGTEKNPWEIWVMWQPQDDHKKIISVWRYPGKSPKGEPPIPEDLPPEFKS